MKFFEVFIDYVFDFYLKFRYRYHYILYLFTYFHINNANYFTFRWVERTRTL